MIICVRKLQKVAALGPLGLTAAENLGILVDDKGGTAWNSQACASCAMGTRAYNPASASSARRAPKAIRFGHHHYANSTRQAPRPSSTHSLHTFHLVDGVATYDKMSRASMPTYKPSLLYQSPLPGKIYLHLTSQTWQLIGPWAPALSTPHLHLNHVRFFIRESGFQNIPCPSIWHPNECHRPPRPWHFSCPSCR